MEDIYDELDNYNEVNCIQELRTENTELKVKLEEHATALEKLQRDYDTLASEFKKLENNYSSLLKTARSEIERKTQRISQLNKEKDMMVIHAVQKGIPIKRHFNKTYQAPYQNKMSAERPAGGKTVKEELKTNIVAKNERYETQPKDNVPVLEQRNKNDYHRAKETWTQHKTEYAEPPVTVASSIKDRRKSTPAVPMPPDMFSTEEDFDQNNPSKLYRDIPPSAKFDRKNINRFDRQSNRSETSSLEDRNSNYREPSRNYHECSKDYKEGRLTRPYDKRLYRGEDKYDSSSRHRKHYSPERPPKKPQRDDYPVQEHGRYRTLESPPHETYSRYHQRNDDLHSNFDRHHQTHNYEKHRPSYEERFALKHRLSTDYDEPHSKRHKKESFGNPDTHFKEDRHNKPSHGHDVRDKQHTPRFSPDEYESLRATCQSPDYEHSDSVVIKPKEIMATAATPLDDPRVTSKKYVVIKENGKEVLSTSVGRNIDMVPVDKIVWNIKPVDIPVALVRRPSQCSQGLVKDINHLSNISVESGELCESDIENRENNKAKEIHHTKTNTTNSAKQEANVEKCEKSVNKYKIPKVGHTNRKSEPKLDVPVIEVGEYVGKSKNVTDKVVIADSSKKKVTDKIEKIKHDNVLSSNKMKNNKKPDKDDSQNQVMSSIAIVADDLELSDENSDNVDTHKQVTEKIVNMKQIREQSKITEAKKDVSKNKIINNANTQPEKIADKVSEAVHVPSVHEKSKETDSTKKHNSKKKRTKSKEETSKDLVKSADVIQDSDKKTKPKHEKDGKNKQSHNKFSDLFGDTSSSLMTPEDLGLPSYLPICENALDMKIDDIIDVRSLKIPDCPDVKAKPNKSAEHIKIPEIIMESRILDVLQKSNTEEHKEVGEKEHQIYSNVPLSNMYKNLNSETVTNEPGVVQTVIISKGLQQQYDDSNAAVMEKPVNDLPLITNQNVTDCNQIQAIVSFKKQDIKALATSTPYKALTDVQIGTETAVKDFTSNSNNDSIKSPDSAMSGINQSQPAALDTQDAPDVRIFVKRRRKVVKQAPVT